MEEMRESNERYFWAHGRPLTSVLSFKYLGQILTASEDYFSAVVRNLCNAQKKWAWLLGVLGWEGSKTRVSRTFFKVVVQVVLLFGSETWVMKPCMGRALGFSQNRVA